MPFDCGFLCLFSDRRRFCEILWRRRLLITNDEKKAKRRFLSLMRGFDSEDLDVLRRAIESNGRDIKQCAPGPPMDLIEEADSDEESELDDPSTFPAGGGGDASARVAGCSTTIISTRPRHSINRLERDRILFQRQKFPAPQVSQPPPPPPPPPHSIAAETPRQYSQRSQQQQMGSGSRRRRASSNLSRTRQQPYDPHDFNASNYDATQHPYYSRSGTPLGSEDDGSERAGSSARRRPNPHPHQRQQSIAGNPLQLPLQLPDEPGGSRTAYEDSGLIPQIDRPMSLPYLCAKLWRWRDLQIDAALHRLDPLPWCRFGRVTINNATVSCCNPYHYALWIRPGHSSSSFSADGADSSRHPALQEGVLANGGHLLGLSDDASMDPLRLQQQQKAIGHVRSTFRSMHEALNANATITATLVNNADEGEGEEDAPPLAPPPPVPITMDYSPTSPTRRVSSSAMNTLVNHVPASAHSQAIAWGRMARWERKDRVGEVVALVGEFVAVGRLAGTVFDGQDVKCPWDIDNQASFALIRQAEGGPDSGEDIWLYNSGERPLFLSMSRSLNSQQRSDAIRRLSPGYCIRVHRSSQAAMGGTARGFGMANDFSDTAAAAAGNAFFSRRGTEAAAAVEDIGRRSTLASVAVDPMGLTSMGINSVSFLTISVGVGWGANYQRLHVTDMPSRYEVIFM